MCRYEMNKRESGFIEDVGRMTKTDYLLSIYLTSYNLLTNTKKKDRKSPKHDDDDANVDDDVALRHFFLPFLSFPLSRRLA